MGTLCMKKQGLVHKNVPQKVVLNLIQMRASWPCRQRMHTLQAKVKEKMVFPKYNVESRQPFFLSTVGFS